jgi:hypothetical protein
MYFASTRYSGRVRRDGRDERLLVLLARAPVVPEVVERDPEALDEAAEHVVIAHHGGDPGREVSLLVAQQEIAEAVRLLRGQHDDAAGLGRGDPHPRAVRE